MPVQTVQRFQVERIGPPYTIWWVNQKWRAMRAGNLLRLQVPAPAIAHWSADGWQSAQIDQSHLEIAYHCRQVWIGKIEMRR